MNEPQIRFDDGAAYEDFMGKWSHQAGLVFLDWLKPPPGLTWADIGCGNGAFTEMLVERCAARLVYGIDPSEGQLKFAKTRHGAERAEFSQGDAMALPYPDRSVDAAVMALVIFFVPEPKRGVAEMVRIAKPGASVSAYAWDITGGGFPYAIVNEELEALGSPSIWPPSKEAARMDNLTALWSDAGLVDLETRVIAVKRTYSSFESFWEIGLTGPAVAKRVASLSSEDVATLKQRMRARVAPGEGEHVVISARANAIKGVVPV